MSRRNIEDEWEIESPQPHSEEEYIQSLQGQYFKVNLNEEANEQGERRIAHGFSITFGKRWEIRSDYLTSSLYIRKRGNWEFLSLFPNNYSEWLRRSEDDIREFLLGILNNINQTDFPSLDMSYAERRNYASATGTNNITIRGDPSQNIMITWRNNQYYHIPIRRITRRRRVIPIENNLRNSNLNSAYLDDTLSDEDHYIGSKRKREEEIDEIDEKKKKETKERIESEKKLLAKMWERSIFLREQDAITKMKELIKKNPKLEEMVDNGKNLFIIEISQIEYDDYDLFRGNESEKDQQE